MACNQLFTTIKLASTTKTQLTVDIVSSLPGQVCPFHPLSTLELVEKAIGFGYVRCPVKMCFLFAPASEWKENLEWVVHNTHSDVKHYAVQLSVIVLTSQP